MKQNAIGWFDIYVTDMSRAVTFYQTVLHCELGVIEDPTDSGALMKSFTADMSVYGAGGALVQRDGAQPGPGGTMVYFGSEDCAIEESRVKAAGGRVLSPKFSIGDYGFVSICMDTEGNTFGLSSMK
jgi:predicted enzyme related to lactoylglutathione lyase